MQAVKISEFDLAFWAHPGASIFQTVTRLGELPAHAVQIRISAEPFHEAGQPVESSTPRA